MLNGIASDLRGLDSRLTPQFHEVPLYDRRTAVIRVRQQLAGGAGAAIIKIDAPLLTVKLRM